MLVSPESLATYLLALMSLSTSFTATLLRFRAKVLFFCLNGRVDGSMLSLCNITLRSIPDMSLWDQTNTSLFSRRMVMSSAYANSLKLEPTLTFRSKTLGSRFSSTSCFTGSPYCSFSSSRVSRLSIVIVIFALLLVLGISSLHSKLRLSP